MPLSPQITLLSLSSLLTCLPQPASAQMGAPTASNSTKRIGNEMFRETYRVTERGGGLGVMVDQTVIFWVSSPPSAHPRWIAERNRRLDNACGRSEPGKGCIATSQIDHDWVDSATCPALVPSLNDLAQLPIPGFAPPASVNFSFASDSSFVEVTGSPRGQAGIGARIAYGEYIDPVASWWRHAQINLQPCFKANI